MKGRHELAIAGKGHDPLLRPLGNERRSVDACFFGGGEQGGVDRIALRRVMPFAAGLRPAGERPDLERDARRRRMLRHRSSRRATSLPAVQSRTSVICPDVSVRVLSVQTTVADPSASTAGSRRTSA